MLSTKANIFAARRGPWAARPMAWPAANLNTEVLTSDQRIRVSPKGLYTYADLSMVCGKPILAEKYTLTNPRVIVEVCLPLLRPTIAGSNSRSICRIESLEEIDTQPPDVISDQEAQAKACATCSMRRRRLKASSVPLH